MTGIELISKERIRQVEEEGWSPKHDATHPDMTLAIASASYILDIASKSKDWSEGWRNRFLDASESIWPFDEEWFKPTHDDPIRQLVKAGALIAAEIDRLQKVLT